MAEETVTNTDEMKNVVAAVAKYYADDAVWTERVDVKLKKREENQDKYDAFQKREEAAVTSKEFLTMIDEIMAELDDPYYARKLFAAAEELLGNQPLDFAKYRRLVNSIKGHIDDFDWIKKIYGNLANNRIEFSFYLADLVQSCLEDFGDEGKALAEEYIANFEAKYDGAEEKSAYDFANLAIISFEQIGDTDKAMNLLGKAEALANSYLDKAYLGCLAIKFGDNAKGETLLKEAGGICDTGADCYQFAQRLKGLGIDDSIVRDLYSGCGNKVSLPADKLTWAEGIIDIFNDRSWAAKAYDNIESSFGTYEDKDMYKSSKKHKLEEKYW